MFLKHFTNQFAHTNEFVLFEFVEVELGNTRITDKPAVWMHQSPLVLVSGGHFAKYWGGGGEREIFNMYAFGVR